MPVILAGFISLSIVVFYFYIKPIESREIRYLQAFNDICLLVCFDYTIIFTELVPIADMRYNGGWLFLGIICLNIGVNLFFLMVPIFILIKNKIK
jgi:hypothetical protein